MFIVAAYYYSQIEDLDLVGLAPPQHNDGGNYLFNNSYGG
jgi:hypothetical protein